MMVPPVPPPRITIRLLTSSLRRLDCCTQLRGAPARAHRTFHGACLRETAVGAGGGCGGRRPTTGAWPHGVPSTVSQLAPDSTAKWEDRPAVADPRDRWAEWLLSRRDGGDADVLRR